MTLLQGHLPLLSEPARRNVESKNIEPAQTLTKLTATRRWDEGQGIVGRLEGHGASFAEVDGDRRGCWRFVLPFAFDARLNPSLIHISRSMKMCNHLHLSFDRCVLCRPSPLYVVCISHLMVLCQPPLRPLVWPGCAATSAHRSHLAFDRWVLCLSPPPHLVRVSHLMPPLVRCECSAVTPSHSRVVFDVGVPAAPTSSRSCLASDECVPYHISATISSRCSRLAFDEGMPLHVPPWYAPFSPPC